jgi:multisubunit Na+/H+ antiporter MnhE subunit
MSTAVSIMVGWVWLVAGTHLHEVIVGTAVSLIATLFVSVVHKSDRERIHFSLRDVSQGGRIVWYLVSDIWAIFVVLIKDLSGVQRAGSYYRVCGFKTSKRDPKIVAREVLATVYSTTTPNSIVIGIDPESSRMLFHQLARTRVPATTQALGAQP